MISKRARYALHGVAFLAYKYTEPPVSFVEILDYLKVYSEKLSFSPGYISKIFQELSRAGIIRALVGRNGGYSLARHPADIRVIEIVSAMDGYHIEECCLLSVGGSCTNQGGCSVNQLILQAQNQFFDFLSSETVDSLSKKAFGKKGLPRPGHRSAKGKTKARAKKTGTTRKKAASKTRKKV